jgi:hypothetical protein
MSVARRSRIKKDTGYTVYTPTQHKYTESVNREEEYLTTERKELRADGLHRGYLLSPPQEDPRILGA